MFPVFKRLQHQSHWQANTNSALSFGQINAFNMAHLHFDFTFNGKQCVMFYCFCELSKTFIF